MRQESSSAPQLLTERFTRESRLVSEASHVSRENILPSLQKIDSIVFKSFGFRSFSHALKESAVTSLQLIEMPGYGGTSWRLPSSSGRECVALAAAAPARSGNCVPCGLALAVSRPESSESATRAALDRPVSDALYPRARRLSG